MFDNLVQSALFPAINEVIDAAKAALVGVKTRLNAQVESGDDLAALIAKTQLDAIAVWEPALDDIMKELEQSRARVSASKKHGGGHE